MPKHGDTVLALFVGGPWDGRREEVMYTDHIRVPVMERPTLLKPNASLHVSEPAFKEVVYRVSVFAGLTMRFVIYAEESLDGDDLMGMLWDGYAPAPKPS